MLGIDTALTTLAEVEHHVLNLRQQFPFPAECLLCTHEVRSGTPHYAVSVSLPGPPTPALLAAVVSEFPNCDFASVDAAAWPADTPAGSAGGRQSIDEAMSHTGGRAVAFPGSDQLLGTLTIGRALELSALDRIAVLGGGVAGPEALLHTRDFVRPLWQGGELVLPVMPAAGGAFAPFEVPNPTECCAAHQRTNP